MKKKLLLLSTILFFAQIFSQKDKMPTSKEILKELSEEVCQCVDSINYVSKEKIKINEEISECIDKQVITYQLSKKLSSISQDARSPNKNVNIELNTNKQSEDYKKSYHEIERYVFDNCPKLKKMLTATDIQTNEYRPTNPRAIEAYNSGLSDFDNKEWENALKNFKTATKEDPKFAFAWDNLGLSYRKLGKYEDAIAAYKKSLSLDPAGRMPLQNLPAAYTYNQQYQKAVDAYLDFDKYYPGDPEVSYGIGRIYYEHLKEYEKSLDYMCKAFNIYTEQKSAYRTDAETIIVYIYKIMKEKGEQEKFNEILKKNNIRPIKD